MPFSPTNGTDALLAGINLLADDADWDRGRQLDKFDDFYTGGERVKQYLIRFAGEHALKWAERQANFATANYVGMFANKLIDGAFGDEVKRSIVDPTEDQSTLLDEIWNVNGIDLLQEEWGQSTVVRGDGWGLVSWDDSIPGASPENVVLHSVHPADIRFWTAPNNPRRIIQLAERRLDPERSSSSKNVYIAWVWTFDRMRKVKDNGETVIDEDNRLGFIPYFRFKGRAIQGTDDGGSYIADQVTLQMRLINLISELGLIVRYQAGSLLVVSGMDVSDIKTGTGTALNVGHDGDAKFISPAAKLDELIRALKHNVEMMFETGGVPVEVIEGSFSESGVALEIKLRPLTRQITSIRRRARVADEDMIRKVCALASLHGLALPEIVEPVVTYNENYLPRDEVAEHAQDLARLNNEPPLLREVDYHMRWTEGVETEEDALEYMGKIKEENTAPTPEPETEPEFDLGGLL